MANITDDQSGGIVVVTIKTATSPDSGGYASVVPIGGAPTASPTTNTSPDSGGVPKVPPIGGVPTAPSEPGGSTGVPGVVPIGGIPPSAPTPTYVAPIVKSPDSGGYYKVVPIGGAPTQIPSISVSSSNTSSGFSSNADMDKLNNRITTFNNNTDAYNKEVDVFNQTWAPFLSKPDAEGKIYFTGSDTDFQKYKKKANELDLARINLQYEEQNIKNNTKRVQDKQTAELANYVKVGEVYVQKDEWNKLDPKYQDIAKTKGFDAMNAVIQLDNKGAVRAALVDSFWMYKKDDGSYDLTQAVKNGLSEHTIALAFGEDAAHSAVISAGKPPLDGWGLKAPTLPYAAGVVTSETLFPPAKQWVEPALHYKATGMDWAIGGAQIALFALPVIGEIGKAALAAATGSEMLAEGSVAAGRAALAGGIATGARLVSGGVQLGATAIFTTDTIQHFDELKKNPWQLAIAIGMDALIARGAFVDLAPKTSARISGKIADIARNASPDFVKYGAAKVSGILNTNIGGTKVDVSGDLSKPIKSSDLKANFDKLSKSISQGDDIGIKEAGSGIKDWAKAHSDNPVSDLLDRRADDFIKNAGDYAKLKDVRPPSNEGPQPSEEIEARDNGLLGNESTLDSLDNYLKSKETPPVPPENPLSKQSIESRLKAKAEIEGNTNAIEKAQNELKAKYEDDAKDKAFSDEMERLKTEAAKNPFSRQSVREQLKAKALIDSKMKALTDAHDTLKARVEAERVTREFEDSLAKAKADAKANPLSRLSVRERLKIKENLDAKAQDVIDSRSRLKSAYDAEKFAQSEVDKIMSLKTEASKNPLSRQSVRERLSLKNLADREIQARTDALNKMKTRMDAERVSKAFEDSLAKAKADAEMNPTSRLSVRETLRVKADLDAKVKAVEDAHNKLKLAYDEEIKSNAFADEMDKLKADAAKNPQSRQSVREQLRIKKNLEAKDQAVIDAQEKLKASVDAETKAKAETDLQKKINDRARAEAQNRLGEKKPLSKTNESSSWTSDDETNLRTLEQKRANGDLEGEDLIDYERLRDKYRQSETEQPGTTESKQGIPTMITRDMEARLKGLGYSDAEINSMTPEEAWRKLNENRSGESGNNEEAPPKRGEGNGDKGTSTAVKEKVETKTETKTKAEQEAETILKERELESKPEAETKEETGTKGETKGKTEVKPSEKTATEAKPEGVKESTRTNTKDMTRSKTSPDTYPKTGIKSASESEHQLEPVTSTRINTVQKPTEWSQNYPSVHVNPNEFAQPNPKENPVETPKPNPVEQPKPIPIGVVKPVEVIEPTPEIKTQNQHEVELTHITPINIKTGTQTRKLPPGGPSSKTEEWTPHDISNATALKAGFGWWLKAADGRQKFFRKLPDGVKPVKPGIGSGYRSIQTVTGTPTETTMKIGFENVSIHKPDYQPGKPGAVNYKPDTTETYHKGNVVIREVAEKPPKSKKPKSSMHGGIDGQKHYQDLGGDVIRTRRGTHVRLY